MFLPRTITCFASSLVLPPPLLAHTVCPPISAFHSLLCLVIIFFMAIHLVISAYMLACLFTGRTPLDPIPFCLGLARSTFYTARFFSKVIYRTVLIIIKVACLALLLVFPLAGLAFSILVAVTRRTIAAPKFTGVCLSFAATFAWTCSVSAFGFAHRSSSYAVSILYGILGSDFFALVKVLAAYTGFIITAKLAMVGRWFLTGGKDLAWTTGPGAMVAYVPRPIALSVATKLSHALQLAYTYVYYHIWVVATSAFIRIDLQVIIVRHYHDVLYITATIIRPQQPSRLALLSPCESDASLVSTASSIDSLDTTLCDSDSSFDDDLDATVVDPDPLADDKLPFAAIPTAVFSPRLVLASPLTGALVPASPNVYSDLGAQKAQAPLLSPSSSYSSLDDVHTLGEGKRKKTRRGGRKVAGWERRARQRARREAMEQLMEFCFDELEDASS